MSKSESEILEVLNGLGSKKLDLDILFSYYSLKLSFEIRKVIAEKIGMQERKGYFNVQIEVLSRLANPGILQNLRSGGRFCSKEEDPGGRFCSKGEDLCVCIFLAK